MKTNTLTAGSKLSLLLFGLLFLLGVSYHKPTDRDVSAVGEGVNAFAFDLLREIAGKGGDNVVISPQSVFHAVAMSYVGSGGKTKRQLRQVMHFPGDENQLLVGLSKLRKQLNETAAHPRVDLNLANSAWLDSTYAEFRKDYVRKLEYFFGVSPQLTLFKDRRGASDRINAWISENTGGRIQRGVSPDDFLSRSRPGVINEAAMVIVNAVFFRADWASQFEGSATREQEFHLDSQRSENAMMMHQDQVFPYAENGEIQFLEMPYIDGSYSMHVLLPKTICSLEDGMRNLDFDTYRQLQQSAFEHKVDVLFPQFEIANHYNMKSTLSDMGADSAFSFRRANFDRMIVKRIQAFRIYLNEVYHDAWIKADEEGSEAAAATTSVHFSFGCGAAVVSPPRAVFHADRPFLYFIVHNESGSIVFMGSVANPNETAPYGFPPTRIRSAHHGNGGKDDPLGNRSPPMQLDSPTPPEKPEAQ